MSDDAIHGQSRPGASGAHRGLTHSILGGLFWTFVGTGGQALLRLLVLVILARLLTPADFGIVSAALVVAGFTTIFSQLGVGPAVVQRPDLDPTHLRAGFTLSVLFGSATTLVIWLLAPAAAVFFHMDELRSVIRVLALTFLIGGLSVVAESLLQRDMRFRRLAVINLVAYTFGYGAAGVGLALMGWGVWALVGAQLAQTALKSGIAMIVQPHPKRPSLDRGAVSDLMYFGGGFTAARLGNYAAGQADSLVVGRWLGAEALGIYGRAYQLMTAPAMFFGEILDRVMFPAMVKVQDEPARLAAAYRRSVALIALMMLPVSAVLVPLAPEIVHVLLGTAWTAVVIPFQVFAVGLVLRTSYKMSDALVRARGSVYRRAWRQVIYALLVFAGAWVGHRGGVAGVALGVLGAIAANFLLMAHLSLDITHTTWRDLWEAHRPSLPITVVLGLQSWGIAALLRPGGLAPVVVLAAAFVAALVTTFVLLRIAPRRVLGADGVWMLRTLSQYLPGRVNPLARLGVEIE